MHKTGFIACLGVTLSTATLLIALSIFNGLEAFVHDLLRPFNPDITVSLPGNRRFLMPTQLRLHIESIPDVESVVEVLQLSALMRCQNRQTVVTLKGVSDNFSNKSPLAPFLQRGNLNVLRAQQEACVLGSGLYHRLGSPWHQHGHAVQIFYPKSSLPKGMAWRSAYKQRKATVEGMFELERQYDDHYALVPLSLATSLTNQPRWRTALEVSVRHGAAVKVVQRVLKGCVPAGFEVLLRSEKQAALLKAIRIERLFVLITFGFILFVTSLNTFFMLAMLVLQKRKDILLLQALGMPARALQMVFLWEGLLVSLVGTTTGGCLAAAMCWAQQVFGFLKLGTGGSSLVETYPVQMQASDFIAGVGSVWIFTLLAALVPARMATQQSNLYHTKL